MEASKPDVGGRFGPPPVMDDSGLAQRAGRALVGALRQVRGADRFGVDGRLLHWIDNLVEGIAPDELQADRTPAAQLGWRAVDSATMLARNSFVPWARCPALLPLADVTGFEVLRFDARCPTGVRGTPPHLDLLALRGDRVVAVTARCTDYLGRRRAKLARAYDDLAAPPGLERWQEELGRLRAQPFRFRHLDATALVKHALGLGRTFPDRPVVLLYLFWEPTDAGRFAAFRRHRDELEELGGAIGGATVSLHGLSFDELWGQWAAVDDPPWLAPLLSRLRQRYAVAIEPGPALS